MKEEHVSAINNLVLGYCKEAGILPEDTRVETRVTFVPIEPDHGPVPPELLDLVFMDALGSYVDQKIQAGGSSTVWRTLRTRVSHALRNVVLDRISGRVGSTVTIETLTVGMAVEIPVDEWIAPRNLGKKNVQNLSDFLKTLHPGLRLGYAHRDKPVTLAGLIAMNLGDD